MNLLAQIGLSRSDLSQKQMDRLAQVKNGSDLTSILS